MEYSDVCNLIKQAQFGAQSVKIVPVCGADDHLS
jgi:hypothetical protein